MTVDGNLPQARSLAKRVIVIVVVCVVIAGVAGVIVSLTSRSQPNQSRNSTASLSPSQRKVESCVTSIAAPAAEAINDLEDFKSSAMASVMAEFSVAHGAAEYGVLQSVVSNVSQNLTSAFWAFSWKSAIKHELPTIESFCDKRYPVSSTTTTTSTPAPVIVPSSISCSTTSGPASGVDIYSIPNVTLFASAGPSVMKFLAPPTMRCGQFIFGTGKSNGLISTGKTPAWIWMSSSGGYDFIDSLCSFSTYLKGYMGSGSNPGPCTPPTVEPSSVRYLAGNGSSSSAAIELISQVGVDYSGVAPYYPYPSHLNQTVYSVFAYNTTQTGNNSFTCSLPSSFANLCAHDAEIYIADLHLP